MVTGKGPTMRIRCLLAIAAILACSTTSALPASAEWFADLYAGTASTLSNDVFVEALKDPTGPTPFTIRHRAVDFDSSMTFGGRFGYWDETWSWLGLALDVSHFRPDVGRQTVISTEDDATDVVTEPRTFAPLDLSVTAFSLDLMLRWPLWKSQQYPKGRLQPYVSGGVALFVAVVDDTTNFGPPDRQSDIDASVGMKASAGVAWHFLRNWALFGEYRFTRFSPEFSFTPVPDPDRGFENFDKTRVETDILTHHLLVGVSFRFW
jgi:opacity protein-like surface antigen